MSDDGYSVNMRRDTRTGECLAVMPSSYDGRNGRYYMAYTLADGWLELTPECLTRNTRTVSAYPTDLKRAVDRNLGYILDIAPRLYG